jgi:hypothetical protein
MKTGTGLSLVVLLVIFLRVYLNIRKTRNRPRLLAAEKLSEAFREEMQDLSQGSGDAFEFLRNAFSKHEKAYLTFRPRLKGKSLEKFDQAWWEYSNGGPQSFLEPYSAAGNMALAKDKRALALSRIRKLLSFAR